MNIDEIKIENFYNAVSLAQRAIFSGLLVASVAILTITNKGEPLSYQVPFVGFEAPSLDSFIIALIILYFFCGLLCFYAVDKAIDNWNLIDNEEVSKYLLLAPSMVISGTFSRAILYSILFTAGTGLSSQALDIDGWKSFFAGSILSFPYFFALTTSKRLKVNSHGCR